MFTGTSALNRGVLQKKEEHKSAMQILRMWTARICEVAASLILVEEYRTHPDMDDGFGGVTLGCKNIPDIDKKKDQQFSVVYQKEL